MNKDFWRNFKGSVYRSQIDQTVSFQLSFVDLFIKCKAVIGGENKTHSIVKVTGVFTTSKATGHLLTKTISVSPKVELVVPQDKD